MTKFHYYGFLYRPPMPGAQPNDGLVITKEIEMVIRGKRLWGFAAYTRKLTAEEVVQYELMEVTSDEIVEGVV